MIDPKYLETLEKMLRFSPQHDRFKKERDALDAAIKELRTMGEIEEAANYLCIEFGDLEMLSDTGFKGPISVNRELPGGGWEGLGEFTSLADAWESVKQEKNL